MRAIRSISDILEITNELYAMLADNFEFDSNGWPIFHKHHFLTDWPDDMVTYGNRNSSLIKQKSATLLCHFAGDRQNYRRLTNLKKDMPVYREYSGVVFLDITITKDMDIEMQKLILLSNQLYAAVLAINDIKLVFNTRCGSPETLECFRNIPRGIVCASSFLGCNSASNMEDVAESTNKILRLMPEKLIIYGKQDKAINEQLTTLGMDYRYYDDFHRRCKRRAA